MNRARRKKETYEQYRANLKAEAEVLEAKLAGVYVTRSAFPRSAARGELRRRGSKFREHVARVQAGHAQQVQSHRKIGG